MNLGSEMQNAPIVRLSTDALPAPIIDAVSASISYYGISKTRGASTSDAVWQIYKVEKSGNITTTTFPDGDNGFKWIWDNRASYTNYQR